VGQVFHLDQSSGLTPGSWHIGTVWVMAVLAAN